MIKRKINYLSIVDSYREDGVLIILIDDFEDICTFCWKHSKVGRISCLLLEIVLLRFYAGDLVFVLEIIQSKVLNFEFFKALNIRSRFIQVDGGIS